jgi:hypothetical protein
VSHERRDRLAGNTLVVRPAGVGSPEVSQFTRGSPKRSQAGRIAERTTLFGEMGSRG